LVEVAVSRVVSEVVGRVFVRVVGVVRVVGLGIDKRVGGVVVSLTFAFSQCSPSRTVTIVIHNKSTTWILLGTALP